MDSPGSKLKPARDECLRESSDPRSPTLVDTKRKVRPHQTRRLRESPTLRFTACVKNYVNFDSSMLREEPVTALEPSGMATTTLRRTRTPLSHIDTGHQPEPLQSRVSWPEYLQGIKSIGQLRRTFEGRYGNYLSLLEVEVQPNALIALTQYYDPPLRCFTFNDFQLAPTLEEYERIIVMPLAKSPPYLFKGQSPSWALVNSRASLKSRHGRLQQEGDWQAFTNVYALLIYGVMLFPYIEDYVDLEVVDAFMAKRDREDNPVIAILANTYYSLNYCYEKNGKALRCCTTLLYLWLTTHIFHSKRKVADPIEDHRWS
ncbi:hypothetical protein CR513_12469, partial [Mucuna pruriens]